MPVGLHRIYAIYFIYAMASKFIQLFAVRLEWEASGKVANPPHTCVFLGRAVCVQSHLLNYQANGGEL